MNLSPAGFDLIKRSEGFRAQKYIDVAGFLTIGYGHKLRVSESYDHGITEVIATALLEKDISSAEAAITELVKVPLTQGQFDALVDFVYNLGFVALEHSTLLRDLNNRYYAAAALQLLLWDHAVESGREQEVAGLKARRQAELQLWNGQPLATPSITV